MSRSTRANAHGAHCTRLIAAGSLTEAAGTGTTRVAFQGPIAGSRALRLGTYEVTVTAHPQTAPTPVVTVGTLHFTIVK